MRTFLIFVFILGFALACDPPSDERLILTNQSAKHLLFNYTCDDSLSIDSPFGNMRLLYSDSIGKTSADINYYFLLIKPNEKKIISTGTGSWNGIIPNCPDKKLRLFLFDFNTIDHTDWQTIRSKKLWVAKYTVSIDSLERLKWQLVYDPNKS